MIVDTQEFGGPVADSFKILSFSFDSKAGTFKQTNKINYNPSHGQVWQGRYMNPGNVVTVVMMPAGCDCQLVWHWYSFVESTAQGKEGSKLALACWIGIQVTLCVGKSA